MPVRRLPCLAIAFLMLPLGLAGCADEAEPDELDGLWYANPEGFLRIARDPGLYPVVWGRDAWLAGDRPAALALPPAASGAVIDGARIAGQFVALEPAEQAGPEGGGVVAWLAVDDRFVASARQAGPPVLEAGQAVPFQLEFALPRGGVPVLGGDTVAIHVGAHYQAGHGTGIALSTPAALELSARAAPPWPGLWREEARRDGHTASDCFDHPEAVTARAMLSFQVPDDAQAVRVRLDRGAGPGVQDVDLWLYNQTGVRVAAGLAPDGHEQALLGPANLAALGRGEWKVRAGCSDQQAPIRVVVELLRPVDAT